MSTATRPAIRRVVALALADEFAQKVLADNLADDGFIINTERPEDADVAVRIDQLGPRGSLVLTGGHTVHEMRAPFTYPDVLFVVKQLIAWGSLADGDPCPTCHAPGIVHKGAVQCDTRACPSYGATIRIVTTADVERAMPA